MAILFFRAVGILAGGFSFLLDTRAARLKIVVGGIWLLPVLRTLWLAKVYRTREWVDLISEHG